MSLLSYFFSIRLSILKTINDIKITIIAIITQIKKYELRNRTRINIQKYTNLNWHTSTTLWCSSELYTHSRVQYLKNWNNVCTLLFELFFNQGITTRELRKRQVNSKNIKHFDKLIFFSWNIIMRGLFEPFLFLCLHSKYIFSCFLPHFTHYNWFCVERSSILSHTFIC